MVTYFSTNDIPGSVAVPNRNGFAGICPIGGIEVPSTLPALTFTWRASQYVSDPTDYDDVVTAIVALLTLSNWVHLDTYSTGNQRAVLIGGPTGSPVEDVRVIVAFGDAAPANFFGAYGADTDVVYAGMSPDAGSEGVLDYDHFSANGLGPAGNVADPFAAPDPFGAYRYTGLGKCGDDVIASGVRSVSGTDSAETLTMYFVTGTVRCFHVGAIMTPPHDDFTEADGRIYGITVSGDSAISATMNGTPTQFPGDSNNGNGSSTVVFDPTATTTLRRCEKLSNGSTTVTSFNTGQGPRFGFPIPMEIRTTGPNMGWMRQMYMLSDGIHGDPVTDTTGSVVGFTLGNSETADVDVLGLISMLP